MPEYAKKLVVQDYTKPEIVEIVNDEIAHGQVDIPHIPQLYKHHLEITGGAHPAKFNIVTTSAKAIGKANEYADSRYGLEATLSEMTIVSIYIEDQIIFLAPKEVYSGSLNFVGVMQSTSNVVLLNPLLLYSNKPTSITETIVEI